MIFLYLSHICAKTLLTLSVPHRDAFNAFANIADPDQAAILRGA